MRRCEQAYCPAYAWPFMLKLRNITPPSQDSLWPAEFSCSRLLPPYLAADAQRTLMSNKSFETLLL